MKKSVEAQLLDFFRENSKQVFASGDLQRRQWFNKNGTLAMPRSIVRRLQELAEEGKIQQVGDMAHAKYSLNAEVVKPKMKQVISYTPQGTVKVEYIPC